jgi:hypothetical protein
MSENERKKSKSDEIPVEDIKEILQVVGTEVPGLIRSLMASIYSAEIAEQYAKGVGTIYKTLKEQGIPEEMLEKLVMKYADSINILGKAMQNINVGKEKDED